MAVSSADGEMLEADLTPREPGTVVPGASVSRAPNATGAAWAQRSARAVARSAERATRRVAGLDSDGSRSVTLEAS